MGESSAPADGRQTRLDTHPVVGRGNELNIVRLELERGGCWRFAEHSPDGVHGFEGRYREVSVSGVND
jgi:hypothetical protein